MKHNEQYPHTCNDIQPLRAHFGQRGPGGLRRVDGEESRAALPGWTRRRRRRSNTKREKRRRAVVSSGDYGDFVVSESMRANDRFCINIVVTTAVLHFVASCNMRSFVTTSSDYGKFLSGTGLVTGAILRRCCRHIKTNQYCSLCQSPTNGG